MAVKTKPTAPRATRVPSPRRVPAVRRAPRQVEFTPTPGQRLHVLSVPWEQRTTATYAKARWHPELRAWVWVGTELPTALAPYASQPYSWERWCEDDLNSTEASLPALAVPAAAPVRLHDHQRAAAKALVAAHQAQLPGFLLADDVGLGKTYATLAGVMRLRPATAVVLCPLAVVPHWRRSIAAMGADAHTRWLVLNYDRAKSLLDVPAKAAAAKRTRTRNRRIATTGQSLVAWDVVVFDESHLLRNPTSQRAATCRRLAGEGQDWEAFCVWLSATAGQNPLQLSYLAPLLGAATGRPVRNLAEFETWAVDLGVAVKRGAYGAWDWVRNDNDLALLRDILFDGDPPVGLRRRPTDLAGWPEQQRIAYPVELDQESRALYDTVWTEFRRELDLAQRGGDPRSGLVAQLRFRQKASLIRVGGTVELVRLLCDSNLQVAVSVQFLETAEAIAAALHSHGLESVTLSGELTGPAREDARIAFQRGHVPVVLFTPTEGFSLHAGEAASQANDVARATVVHDCRYSALDAKQIEGRTHRDGQAAVCYYTFAQDTVEEVVVARTIERLTDMGTMLGDDTAWSEQLAEVLFGYTS